MSSLMLSLLQSIYYVRTKESPSFLIYNKQNQPLTYISINTVFYYKFKEEKI
jgi:hypothetical protein